MDDVSCDPGALAETVVFVFHFKGLPDGRKSKVRYPLDEVLMQCLQAVIAGAEVNWPPFRPDSRPNAGGLGISSSTGLWLMADDYRQIELITGEVRRRHWTTEQKLQIIEESFLPGETVSSVAQRRGVASNLLYRWRRLLKEGGAAAVGSDESVVGSSEVRRLEERVRDLERLLGRKTMEVEILKDALARSESKKPNLRLLSQPRDGSR